MRVIELNVNGKTVWLREDKFQLLEKYETSAAIVLTEEEEHFFNVYGLLDSNGCVVDYAVVSWG